jgi:hypothetical protein
LDYQTVCIDPSLLTYAPPSLQYVERVLHEHTDGEEDESTELGEGGAGALALSEGTDEVGGGEASRDASGVASYEYGRMDEGACAAGYWIQQAEVMSSSSHASAGTNEGGAKASKQRKRCACWTKLRAATASAIADYGRPIMLVYCNHTYKVLSYGVSDA